MRQPSIQSTRLLVLGLGISLDGKLTSGCLSFRLEVAVVKFQDFGTWLRIEYDYAHLRVDYFDHYRRCERI